MARLSAWKKPFLLKLAETGNLSESSAAVGIDRTTVHKARKRSPQFQAQYDEAMAAAMDKLSDEAMDLAMGRGREQSENMVRFILSRRHPEYREKKQLEHNINAPPAPLIVETVSDETDDGAADPVQNGQG